LGSGEVANTFAAKAGINGHHDGKAPVREAGEADEGVGLAGAGGGQAKIRDLVGESGDAWSLERVHEGMGDEDAPDAGGEKGFGFADFCAGQAASAGGKLEFGDRDHFVGFDVRPEFNVVSVANGLHRTNVVIEARTINDDGRSGELVKVGHGEGGSSRVSFLPQTMQSRQNHGEKA
jgi:hypothetical protein